MKALSFLLPVLNLIRRFGFIYRLIGIAGCVLFFSSNIKDVLFLSSTKGVEPITIEELTALPKNEIPRYLKLENISIKDGLYVATQNEETGKVLNASYPVYSIQQLLSQDSTSLMPITAHVIVKDKNFHEDSLMVFMTIDGMYDDESFGEARDILMANGVNVSSDAILIVKEKPPVLKSSILWSVITGVLGLLILLSFVPNRMYGVQAANEEEQVES